MEDVNNLPPVELIRPIGEYESYVLDYQNIKYYLNNKLLGDFCDSLVSKSQNVDTDKICLNISKMINNKINPYTKKLDVLLKDTLEQASSDSKNGFLKQYRLNIIRLDEVINIVINFALEIKEALKT